MAAAQAWSCCCRSASSERNLLCKFEREVSEGSSTFLRGGFNHGFRVKGQSAASGAHDMSNEIVVDGGVRNYKDGEDYSALFVENLISDK
jgi:hypothetical protein